MMHKCLVRADSNEGGTGRTRTVSQAGLHDHFSCRDPFHQTRRRQ